jgi:hypothetical protein
VTRGGAAPGLGDLLRAGRRAVSAYTGTLLALFLVQALVVLGATAVIAMLFAGQFAHRPLFDDGVDGDLMALYEALRDAGATLSAIGWIGVGGILAWLMLSWFLAGGLVAVLAERPQGRPATLRTFGAGGAATFLVFARLALISAVLHAVVWVVAAIGLGLVAARIEYAMTLGEVLGALTLGLAPALLLLAVVWTVIDHARVELVLRRPSHERLGAIVAFARSVAFVARRPLALAHVLLWAAAFGAVSALYTWASFGAAMLGASGAIALLIVRQGVGLVRMALKVMLIGGQVELGQSRPPPPRPAPRA